MAEYHNPQHEQGTEKRVLIVFVLTFVLFVLFQPLLKKYFPQSATPPPQTQSSPTPAPGTASNGAVATPPARVAAIPQGTKQASSESETTIENDLYKIRFSNKGAQVKSWILKKYTDDQGAPLELVNKAAAEQYGYPLSLWTYDESQRNKLNAALYVSSKEGSLSAPSEINFEYSDSDIAVTKTFKFDHSYVVQVETSVTSKGASVSALPMWPAGFGDEVSVASYASAWVEYQYNNNVERVQAKKISGGNTIAGPMHWAGIGDQYFGAVFIPQDARDASLVTLRYGLDVPRDPQKPQGEKTKVDIVGAAVGNLHGPTVQRMYVGPKSLPILESVSIPGVTGAEPDLRALVDFGWLGLIARPLFLWLKWTYNHIVANWGWAIVIQTIIINLALLPLRISQMKSMLKMQKIQPQIKSIQEKYKKYSMRDPRKAPMNEEIQALYKQEGVNPVGGCLPLVIQMPFLFAYYRMLGVAIDLRHAPWLWIRDLSAPDPWHLLPVAIIITMLLMQRSTPQAGMDPAQQKMMNVMMPVMLGVISWNLAAGLCLYWSVGNVIGIVQQSIMNRTTLGREMREMMEKRAKKKDK
ncbi:MAG TPA: membrane protein insertase YidC [Terriglobales bacterium]|nr:membrane protein insertase YidC [Terriglobales bacterium]